MASPVFRNPRSEATALLPPGYEARVLEPSPPASADREWFADDPTAPGSTTATLVTPIANDGTTWDEMATSYPGLAGFVSAHWLGLYKRLEAVESTFQSTRRALHQLAFYAMAPARHTVTGKMGLRYTHGGFGTPFFGADEQVRFENGYIVRQTDRVASRPVTTLADAVEVCGIPYRRVWFDGFKDTLDPIDANARLDIDSASVASIAEWFGFGTSVLEQLRRTPGALEVSRVQLWPEHFDLAIEMGPGETRASYGASPGDDHHLEPYLYVSAEQSIDRSNPFWNDSAFNGASLPYRALLEAEDQHLAALSFFDEGHRILNG